MHYAPFNPASSELGTLLLLRLAAHKWVARKFSTQRLAPCACSEELEAEAAIRSLPKTSVLERTRMAIRAVWVRKGRPEQNNMRYGINEQTERL